MRDIHAIKNIYLMLLVLLIGVCVFATVGSDRIPFVENDECELFDEGWYYYTDTPEETKELMIPSRFRLLEDEEFRMERRLPQDLQSGKYLCLLSEYQTITVLVDDEVVFTNQRTTEQKFGKSDGTEWLFVPMSSDYAGKTAAIIITSPYASASGKIDHMYYGSRAGIIYTLLKKNGFSFFSGCILLILCVIFFVVYELGRYSGFHWNNYLYLCFFTMCMAVWLICESKLGQLVCSNIRLLNILHFTSLMLAPIPILLYTNSVEKSRYGKEFNLMCWVFIVNFIAQISLYVTNACDFIGMLWVTYILILMIFVTVLISLFVCYRETKSSGIKTYFEGLLGLFLFTIADSLLYYRGVYDNVGNCISVGILFYVIILSHASTVERLVREREKIMAVSQNQAKTNFLARMSHEIRTPMNAIIGMNDMILNENINEDVRKYAVNIKNSANVMMNLLSDVLDFSKIESGKMELINSNYQLFNLLRDVIGITSVTADNKHLEFIYEIDEGIPSGYFGDEVRIRQVLLNILNNAVKYTQKGYVKMKFHCECNGFLAMFTVSVEDTGVGIKKEELGKIFDTFERVGDEKNRRVEGFGLGLAITRQLLDLMGGSIEIQSEYGKGSTFTVRIPQKIVDRSIMEPLTEQNIVRSSSQKSAIEGKYAGKRILAVDDNVVNLQVVAGLLKNSKIRVDGVLSGDKCLSAMAKYHYDLIFMDHRMPGMDGVETLKYIRGNPVNRDIPVIVLTANAVEGAREDFLAEGFDDYLSKPISAKRFYEMLDKYLT